MMTQDDDDTLHFRNDGRPSTTNPTRTFRSRINMDIFEAKKILGYQTNVRVGDMSFDDLQKKFIDRMQREKDRSQREKEKNMNTNEQAVNSKRRINERKIHEAYQTLIRALQKYE